MSWSNWAGDETCTPAETLRPGSVEELAAGIVRARDAGLTVRVAGAGHSFGDLVCTDGVLLSLDGLSGIQHLDPVTGLVKVGAGTRLHELNPLLAEAGRALPNLGDIDQQSVAGAISTATHGTGAGLGNLATQVEELELVAADGQVHHLRGGDDLLAARVSLGALGVISSVTLRTVPAFRLHGVDVRRPLDDVLDALDEHVDGNDHFEFFVFPHTHHALTRTNNRTSEPPRPIGPLARKVDRLVQNQLLDGLCRVGRRFPSQIPRINRAVTRIAPPSTRTDVSHAVFASPREVRFTESEWAVPREQGATVVREVMAMVERRRFAVNFPLEVRFVAADEESLLSPSWGRETCYVAVHMYRGMEWREYFHAVQEIALAHGGRPHWGKRHLLDAEALAPLYPGWERFQAVRRRLDPNGLFSNDHVRRVLG